MMSLIMIELKEACLGKSEQKKGKIFCYNQFQETYLVQYRKG